MQNDDEEYLAYTPYEYQQINGDPPKEDDEDEFAYEKALTKFKRNKFMDDYNSATDISFKRVKRVEPHLMPQPPSSSGPVYDYSTADDTKGGRGDKSVGEGDTNGGGGDTSGGGGFGGGGGVGGGHDSEEIKLYLTPVIVLTAFFALLFIIGPLLVRKGPNRGIVQCSIMITAFCMWIFWVTVYIGQINPLMGPRLENTTIAWMSVKLGDPVAPAANVSAGGE